MIKRFNSAITVTTLDLLRHGECEGGHCYRGSIDVALLATGKQQMASSLSILPAQWQRIISSPLQRCAVFAKELSTELKTPLTIDDRIRETSFGAWEGQSIQRLWDTQQDAVEAWSMDPVNHPPPDGEAADLFAARVVNAVEDCIHHYCGQHLLMVTHGGVIRVLLAHCLNMSLSDLYRLDVPYACLSRVQIINDAGQHFYQLKAHDLALTSRLSQPQ
ncbi:MAG: alpha-ribazole phosphatase family protein [Pseudomonadota bacterium]